MRRWHAFGLVVTAVLVLIVLLLAVVPWMLYSRGEDIRCEQPPSELIVTCRLADLGFDTAATESLQERRWLRAPS
jgi:hypothetical protein